MTLTMPDTHYCHFCQYGNVMVQFTIKELIELRKTHGIIARVENSGSEGYYVEVARWNDLRSRWEKFAFEKFLGGEIWADDNGYVTAEKVCNLINGEYGENESLIHSLPSWGTTVP